VRTNLAEQSQDLEASVVDFELRTAGEAGHAVCEGVEEVQQCGCHNEGELALLAVAKLFEEM
jgi:hypothetical protein